MAPLMFSSVSLDWVTASVTRQIRKLLVNFTRYCQLSSNLFITQHLEDDLIPKRSLVIVLFILDYREVIDSLRNPRIVSGRVWLLGKTPVIIT